MNTAALPSMEPFAASTCIQAYGIQRDTVWLSAMEEKEEEEEEEPPAGAAELPADFTEQDESVGRC